MLFGLFVQLRVVLSRALIAQDVEHGQGDMAMDREGKGLVHVDAAFDGEGQQMFFEPPRVFDGDTHSGAPPIFDDCINQKRRAAIKIDADACTSVLSFRNQRNAVEYRYLAASKFQGADDV